MACDLAVMVDDAFIRHVGPRARLGARRRRDAVADDHGRRPARARDRPACARRSRPRKAAEWGLVNWAVPAAELDAKVDEVVENLAREAPADDALREAAPELLARPRVARDDQPRARLARALDGDRGAAGGGAAVPGEASDEPLVLVERDGAIAVVLLNRPKQLNALSDELMDELVASARGARPRTRRVRCIVLGGSERAFAAGADIGELAQRRRSSSTTSGASSAGTRSAASGRRSSRPSRASASAAAASWRWPAT